MAGAYVQGTGVQSVGSVSSVAKAFASNVTAGNALAVGASSWSDILGASAITDTRSSTYTRHNNVGVGGGAYVANYSAPNITGGACTVTCTGTASGYLTIVIAEFSGLSLSSLLDVGATGTGTSASPVTGNLVTTVPGVLFGVVTHDSGTAWEITEGGSYTLIFEDLDAVDKPINGVYRLVPNTGTYTVGWTLEQGQGWACAAIALRDLTTIEQEGYRWRNDDGSETAATWKASQDTAITSPTASNTRLRVLLNAVGDPVGGTYQLEYRRGSDAYKKLVAADDFPVIASSANTVGTNGTSVSVTMPTDIVSGDLLVMVCTQDNPAPDVMAVSGWTQLYQTGYTGDTIRAAAFAKLAVGSDTATMTGAAQDFAIVTMRITGHGVTTIASDIKVGTTSTGETNAPDPPSLDAGSSRKWLWIEAAHSDDDDNTATYWSANYSAVAQAESAQSTSSCMTSVGQRNNETQTENPGTMALAATEQWLSNTIAIPPYAHQILLALSSNIAASGENTTALLTAPSGKSTSDFDAGRMQDDENPADSIDITADDYTEVEWCLTAVAGVALTNDVYQFRVTIAGTAIDTYTVTPQWTIGTAGTTVNLSSLPASAASSAINPTVILGSLSLNLSSVPAAAAASAVNPTVILGSLSLNLSSLPATAASSAVDPTIILSSLSLNLSSLPATAASSAVNPTVVLGSLTLDLSAVPATAVSSAVNPTVSIQDPPIDLSSLPATAASSAVNPTVILGSLTIDLSSLPAVAASSAVNPTVVLGSLSLDLSSLPAVAASSAVNPTVTLGSVSVNLSAVPATAASSAVDPTVILGSLTLSLAAVPASVTSSAVDPTVSVSGGSLTIDLSSLPATAASSAVNPTVTLGSVSVNLSAVPATVASSAVDPTVILGSLSLDLSAVSATATSSAVNPTVILGSLTLDLSSLPASAASSAVDPSVSVSGGSLTIDLSSLPATATSSAVNPTVILGSVSVNLSTVPATAASSAVDPTVILGSLALSLSAVPASVAASAVSPTIILGSVTVDLSGLPAAVTSSAVSPTVIFGSLSLDLSSLPATAASSAVSPTVLAGLFNVPGLWLVWSEPAGAWLIWSDPAAGWVAWTDTAAAWRYWLDPQEAIK